MYSTSNIPGLIISILIGISRLEGAGEIIGNEEEKKSKRGQDEHEDKSIE